MRMIKGWAFNPPPHWPKPPGDWMPPAGWQPDPAWGPLPPGWQLWVPQRRPQRRPAALVGAGLAMLLATAVVGAVVPRQSGPPAGDPLAGGSVQLRPPLRAALIAPAGTGGPFARATPGATGSTEVAGKAPGKGTRRATRNATGKTAGKVAGKPAPGTARTRTPEPTFTPVVNPSHRFLTCSALTEVYPNGLGLPDAVDRTSGTPVVDFGRSTSLYTANRAHDRDQDGIACEPS
jgi:hypothetical protein